MPVNFQLAKKEEPNEPVRFGEIDDEICKHFGIEPDPVHYLWGWYDSIGLRLAIGRSFEEIKSEFEREKEDKEWASWMLKIVEYLEERYVSYSWRS